MLSCQQCGAPNTANSKFCSQCGWPVSPGDVQAVNAQASKDVAEGQRLFGESRVVEALAMASTVLLLDPDNVPALALKGDCLERSGDIEGALTAYEHVVTLKPDSPLDRIRVAQLRRLAAAPQAFVEERPERRNSILAGAAAFLLMTSAGSALYLANTKVKVVSEAPKVESPVKSVPFTGPAPVPTQTGDTKEKSDVVNNTANASQPNTDDSGSDPRRNYNGAAPYRSKGKGLTLDPSYSASNDSNQYRPVDPKFQITPENPPQHEATANSDPDPTAEKGQDDAQKTDSGRQPVIDIHPSNPPAKTEGGSQVKDSANESTSLIRVARQYFLAGEYDKAAKAYERAIRLGASTASANHRLAQCYVNLRRRPEALTAYKTALAAYQRMLNGGVGDKRLVESYMEECRQAIKLLQ